MLWEDVRIWIRRIRLVLWKIVIEGNYMVVFIKERVLSGTSLGVFIWYGGGVVMGIFIDLRMGLILVYC